MFRTLFIIVLVAQSLPVTAQEPAPGGAPRVYTAEQIRADFESLYEGLQAANYDLYAFTPRSEFDNRYREYREKLDQPMTRFDAEMAFQPFVALARQAHTRVDSDFSGFFAYLAAGGTVFPLDVAVDGGQLLVTGNSSGEARILPGDRITAINGQPVSELLPRLVAHISAETPEFAHVLLESYMPLVLWLELGRSEASSVSVEHASGSGGTYDISTAGDTKPESGAADVPFSLEGGDARMLTETIAYLRPGPFSNTDENASPLDATAFLKFVDSSFESFIENRASQLILDLRDNPGGHNAFSDPIIAWFADRPFRFSSNFRVRISPQSTAANQARLDSQPSGSDSVSQLYAELYASTDNGETVLFPIPEVEPRAGARFDGEVYVLVNRYSFSNAVSAAALIQDYGFGTVMGEQTVDMATLHGAMERFSLPNTGIVVAYPKALIVRPNGNESTHPVSPDIQLPAPRIRGATDIMLEAAISRIETLRSRAARPLNTVLDFS